MTRKTGTEAPTDELLWGVKQIAEAIGRDPKGLYWHLERRHLKSVRKICGRYVASRRALLAEVAGGDFDAA